MIPDGTDIFWEALRITCKNNHTAWKNIRMQQTPYGTEPRSFPGDTDGKRGQIVENFPEYHWKV